ncbi:GTP cyclohydrolase [Flagellimonas sp. HMM57]|uniref:GTP cyclohydrolase n=1 Tax=unclassified Flagellimonas TaxID=2644544 RepID=UPI0013D10AB9|nr:MULTISPECIES: GTP cyclohydrolase [unclassified Flagellimonas]UII75956.1 GTP cyclohydrolase [Flagellimonas sp. HMM57]
MKTIEKFMNYRLLALLFAAFAITSCSDDDDAPEEEEELEVITNVTLIFTNDADSSDEVRARAVDSDGLGTAELEVLDEITLAADTQYTLTFEILNALDPDDVEDIGDEIKDEDDEHQIFFSFTEDAFDSPGGNGNIDTASDPINYNDQDENGNPVGLSTSWTTPASGTTTDGTFTVILQHQPGEKTSTSGTDIGEDDFTLEFVLNIE